MSVIKDFEDLLTAKKEMEAKRPDLFRLKRFLEEKRQKGIIPKKDTKVPSRQETERYGYDTLFGN
ncbi:MAG: hypothetical protein FJ126_07565 [Deltaproteobacteria bacterium]|nr:hypothetical protein [Deltaproteobacteria bacterium]